MLAGDANASYRPLDLDKATPAMSGDVGVFDFVNFVEVIEHIDPANEDNLVKFVSGTVRSVLMFTGAHEGQKGYGHFNCRNKDHWIQVFIAAGLSCDNKLTAVGRSIFRAFEIPFEENLLVFRKPAAR